VICAEFAKQMGAQVMLTMPKNVIVTNGGCALRVKDGDVDEQREFVIISFSEDQRFLNLKRLNYNMVRRSWVLACQERCMTEEGRNPKAVELQPKFMMYMNKETEKEFSSKFDQFGDGYMDLITKNDLVEMLTTDSDVTWTNELANVGAGLSKKEICDMEATLAACGFEMDDKVVFLLSESADLDGDVTMSESESHDGRKLDHGGTRASMSAARRKMSESESSRGGSDRTAAASRKRKEREEGGQHDGTGDTEGVWMKGVVSQRLSKEEEYLVYYYDSSGKPCEKSVPFRLVQSEDPKQRAPPLAWSAFGGCKVQVVDIHDEDLLHVSRLKLATACLIAGGGELVTLDNEHEKNFILVEAGFDSDSDQEISRRLRERNVSWDDTVRIVDESWVIERFRAGKMLLDESKDVQDPHEYFLSMDED
jgi:hypothetical protein